MGKDTCRHGSAIARNDVSRLTRVQRLGEDQIAKPDLPRHLPDMRPAPSAGFCVSRL
jgi:hypothetical protein